MSLSGPSLSRLSCVLVIAANRPSLPKDCDLTDSKIYDQFKCSTVVLRLTTCKEENRSGSGFTVAHLLFHNLVDLDLFESSQNSLKTCQDHTRSEGHIDKQHHQTETSEV